MVLPDFLEIWCAEPDRARCGRYEGWFWQATLGGRLLDNVFLRLQNDSQEFARCAIDGDHAVPTSGIVKQHIAGAELLGMLLVLEAHTAFQDIIKPLPA